MTEHSLGRPFYRKGKKKKGKQSLYVHPNFNSLKYIGPNEQVFDLRIPKFKVKMMYLTPVNKPFWLYERFSEETSI